MQIEISKTRKLTDVLSIVNRELAEARRISGKKLHFAGLRKSDGSVVVCYNSGEYRGRDER